MAFSNLDHSRMEEDLSSLLFNQLTLSNQPAPHTQSSAYTAPPTNVQVQVEQPIKYSISQHYHHSAHLAPPRPAVDSQVKNTSETDQLTAEIILARNGVDPNALFPSQLTLFRQADVSQQMRLIELWRISPSDYGTQAYALEFNQEATMQEVQKSQAVQEPYQNEMQDITDTDNGVETGMTDASENTDRSSATSSTTNYSGQHNDPAQPQIAEPYVISGYEVLARRDYDEQVWQQEQKKSFSPLGTAVGHMGDMVQYAPAFDPVYQHTNNQKEVIEGQETIPYQSGMIPHVIQFRGLLTAPHTDAGGEDQEML